MSDYMPGLRDEGEDVDMTHFPASRFPRPRELGNRWFGVTWMRSSAPPHVVFLWLRFGHKRRLFNG